MKNVEVHVKRNKIVVWINDKKGTVVTVYPGEKGVGGNRVALNQRGTLETKVIRAKNVAGESYAVDKPVPA